MNVKRVGYPKGRTMQTSLRLGRGRILPRTNFLTMLDFDAIAALGL